MFYRNQWTGLAGSPYLAPHRIRPPHLGNRGRVRRQQVDQILRAVVVEDTREAALALVGDASPSATTERPNISAVRASSRVGEDRSSGTPRTTTVRAPIAANAYSAFKPGGGVNGGLTGRQSSAGNRFSLACTHGAAGSPGLGPRGAGRCCLVSAPRSVMFPPGLAHRAAGPLNCGWRRHPAKDAQPEPGKPQLRAGTRDLEQRHVDLQRLAPRIRLRD